ncbi:hypothetical protein [Pararobbsia alpina]|uniref:Uncharacterized protein n=1 Tax=Pararobbsia alpina TaxID=621374 RepID=A0A6S7B3F9_9BURK|nr:hypothetical protein [Pararobbsia alpina]CAB3784189.1 hypothetical protein LMG28138_01759 [Pararobbsia alpina]
MNKAIISGGLTVSATDLVPTINWAISGFHGLPPANLSGLVAGAVVMGLHAGYNWLASRAAKPVATQPATPAQ